MRDSKRFRKQAEESIACGLTYTSVPMEEGDERWLVSCDCCGAIGDLMDDGPFPHAPDCILGRLVKNSVPDGLEN